MTTQSNGWATLLQMVRERLPARDTNRRHKPDELACDNAAFSTLVTALTYATLNCLGWTFGEPLSFNNNSYVGTGISVRALRRYRDDLIHAGLARWTPGFHSAGDLPSYNGRLVPTQAFRDLVSESGVTISDIPWTPRPIIELRKAAPSAGPEPDEVTQSRVTITRLNDLMEITAVELPEAKWESLREEAANNPGWNAYERYSCGNTAAKYVRRIFNGTWDAGGRLYGPWWQQLPKSYRRHLTIDGKGTIELDYRYLHPAILYAQVGMEVPGDPYLVQGYLQTSEFRKYGKTTFNRLLNKKSDKALRYDPEDQEWFSEKSKFRKFEAAMLAEHAAVLHRLRVGEGVRLQCEDSKLALDIASRFSGNNIPLLTVHDSFIVTNEHEHLLTEVMLSAFHNRYGSVVKVKKV